MHLRIPEKLALTFLLLLTSLTGPPSLSLVMVVVILIVRVAVPGLRPLDKRTASRFWRVLGFLFVGAVVMTFLNGGLIREGPVLFQFEQIALYEGGMAFGIRTGTRLLLMTSALLMLFGSTPLTAITAFLFQAGVPHQIVMTVHLTVHFVASMPARIERIYAAQEARGAPVRSRFLARMFSLTSIVSPLILSSIVESIERGKALELRGYSGTSSWTPADDLSSSTGRGHRPSISFLTVVFLFLSLVSLFLPWLLG